MREFGSFYKFCFNVAKTAVAAINKKDWAGQEHLPEGGFIAVSNHATNFDALTFMYFLGEAGIPPRMLAKAELFDIPVLGAIMRKCKQVPVYRGSDRAGDALAGAEKALLAGECVGIFPEGTLTEDPNFWPMRGKTGAARLALRTHVPVIPIAQWGALEVLPQRSSKWKLYPPTKITMRAMEPVYLEDLYERGVEDHEAVKEATARIMKALTQGVAQIRGEVPPAQPFEPTKKSRSKRPYKKRSMWQRLRKPFD